MPFVIIDTLAFAKRIQKSGLQKEVVKELAEALKETQERSLEGLATKQDLRLEQKLTLRLGSLVVISAITAVRPSPGFYL